MKKVFLFFTTIVVLTACTNSGESGVVNDGDSPGKATNHDIYPPANPSTDTAAGEHRVDIQKRDSF